MTRSVIGHLVVSNAGPSPSFVSFQMLTDVLNSGAESTCLGRKRFIASEEMRVRSQHRAAAAGIRDNWRITRFAESRDILASKNTRAIQVAGVCVKCTATNLANR